MTYLTDEQIKARIEARRADRANARAHAQDRRNEMKAELEVLLRRPGLGPLNYVFLRDMDGHIRATICFKTPDIKSGLVTYSMAWVNPGENGDKLVGRYVTTKAFFAGYATKIRFPFRHDFESQFIELFEPLIS